MIARKILALLDVVQQAAPGNVSTRGLPERCSIVRSKQRHCRLWPHQETFAGAACQHTLSLANPMFQQHPFNLGQSKAAPLQARCPRSQFGVTCGIEADVENHGLSGAFSITRRRNR
jgi:hypothetical protein